MSHERLYPGFSFTQERIEQLRVVVPEAFADGEVNWAVLREALGDWLEDSDEETEHFGLTWPGKRAARRLAALPSRGTLVPATGEGVDEEKTRNVFIEGDNLEVLKLLQKSYAGRVKMIYIDPPYNTGNDFVYEDDFAEPIETYLRRTGQLDEKGQPLTTNTRADGRFHSKWLSMMYPRLRLARSILADDGLIMVSIDDNEVVNCRSLMNEIFGEENFLESFIWKKSYGGGKERYVVRQHEYILLFARAKESVLPFWLAPSPDVVAKYYRFRDEAFNTRGPYRLQPLEAAKSMDTRPNLKYGVPVKGKKDIWPKRQWLWKKERVLDALAKGEVVVSSSAKGTTLSYKQYLYSETGEERGKKPVSVLEGPYTQEGTKDLADLFGGKAPTQYPKPVRLIEDLIGICCPDDYPATIVDFFAGAATLGHAALRLNRTREMPLRFACVQLPETIPDGDNGAVARELGLTTVADIGKERLRRAIQQLKKDKEPGPNEDLGFRVLKLNRSYYRAWADYEGDNINTLVDLFAQAEQVLTDDWTPEGLLIEVMLIEGFSLDSRIEVLNEFTKNTVTNVASDHCEHRLVICFDKKVHADTLTFHRIFGHQRAALTPLAFAATASSTSFRNTTLD